LNDTARSAIPALQAALQAFLPRERLLSDPAECLAYGFDNSRRHGQPALVVLAETHDEVAQTLKLCNEYRVAVTARGRGTATTGATTAIENGLVLSLERMRKIVRMDPGNRLLIAEPGVTNAEVQQAAGEHGFFWAPDPSSAEYCSIGGNLATGAGGPRAVKYGTVRENVLGLRAVTANGQEIRTGSLTTKGVVGYDLTRLLIASEGTLAIITEAALKLTPLAETKRTLRIAYRDVHAAARAVARIMAQPVTPCALEFLDHHCIDMTAGKRPDDLPEGARALLMIEVDGPKSCIDGMQDAVIAAAQGEASEALEIKPAATQAEVNALWSVRKALSPVLRSLAPKKINEDVVVPVTQIPALIEHIEQLAVRHQLPIVNFGHAGNGNLHVNLLVHPERGDELERAHAALAELFKKVLQLEGSLSGEHGVGLEKRDYIDQEIDAPTLALMRALQRTFDPNNILNPGKSLPA
jgi:D-lactate dehydrogenase